MANDLMRGRQTVAPLTNKSGGGVVAGDVVILSSGTASSFTTTTSAAQADDWVGVAQETIANDASGRILQFGYAPIVNLASSASLGDYLRTHTVAKQAQRFGTSGVGDFGQVLGTGTSPAAIIWGHPTQSTGGGSGSITIEEIDGTPTGSFDTLKFPNGTLTDNMDSSATFTPASGTTPGLVKIDETIIAGSSVASITIGSIPGTYRDLEIRITGRGTTAATSVAISLIFNADTGANYGFEQTFFSNTSVGAAGTGSATSMGIASLTGATAPANTPGVIRITVFDYARTQWFKNALIECYTDRAASAAGQVMETFGGAWRSTAAVTAFTVTPSAGNLAIGTVVSLYGIGG